MNTPDQSLKGYKHIQSQCQKRYENVKPNCSEVPSRIHILVAHAHFALNLLLLLLPFIGLGLDIGVEVQFECERVAVALNREIVRFRPTRVASCALGYGTVYTVYILLRMLVYTLQN
jgi:hypothetical protein